MKADLSALTRGRGLPDLLEADEYVPMPRRRWKTRVLVPGAIFTATAAVLMYSAGAAILPATSVRVVPVMVKSGGHTGGGRVVAQAPGWVEADPYSIAVSALTDGVIREVVVLEGQPVAAGQVVARLVDDDARLGVDRARSALLEGEAALSTAQATLEAAQRTWEHPIELTRKLAAAEAMLAEKMAELARWPAELAAEEAKAAELEADYERVAALHEREQTSQIEFIRTRQQYLAQRAMADAMKAREAIILAQIKGIEAEVEAGRENLRLRIEDTQLLEAAKAHAAAAAARVEQMKAMLGEATLRLERTEIRSPAAGIVMTRLVEPGAKVMLSGNEMRSAYVLRLFDPAKLQVRVDVPLADAAKVGVGQPAEIIVDVLPDRVFQGEVTRIVNEADVQKNTLQVKVAIRAPAADLKPEMLARARFMVMESAADQVVRERLYVPQGLLRKGADGGVRVWLADQARQVAVDRPVTPGGGTGAGWIEIDSGLNPGDRLIADPPADLRDGGRIRIAGEMTAFSAGGGMNHGAD